MIGIIGIGLTFAAPRPKREDDMVFKKCPGQDISRKMPDEVVCDLTCPFCGAEVEFFFDDRVRICPECGNKIAKSDIQLLKDLGCADWCEAAEKCIGTALYSKIKEAKGRRKPGT